MDKKKLQTYYQETVMHQKEHKCTGVPYAYGDMLATLIAAVNALQVLEIGTGLGYATACLMVGNRVVHINTIDKDADHMLLAEKKWRELGVFGKITPYIGKAEDILPEMHDTFDVIFFDANVPQKKFITQFDRLLRKGGLLLTTNLFLRDEKGGKYLLELQDEKKWRTAVFADTAVSVKK